YASAVGGVGAWRGAGESLPAQEDRLHAEAGSHPDHDAVRSRRWRLGKHVVEDAEHRGARHVADAPETRPPRTHASGGQAEYRLRRAEHLRAAGMDDPRVDLGAGQPVIGEQRIVLALQCSRGDFGQVRSEDQPEPGLAYLESEGVL